MGSRPVSGERLQRHLAAASLDEIEFQFARDHRSEPVGSESVDHARQHRARVERAALAVERCDRADQLRDVEPEPRRGDKAAGNRHQHVVGVARFPHQAARLAIGPENVDRHDRARDEGAAFINLGKLGAPQPLAARDSRQRGEQRLHKGDVGIGREKGFRFRSVRAEPAHDAAPNVNVTALRSAYFASAWRLRSRPKPDCLKPPNGIVMSHESHPLTHTSPALSRRAARCARSRLAVHTPAARP